MVKKGGENPDSARDWKALTLIYIHKTRKETAADTSRNQLRKNEKDRS